MASLRSQITSLGNSLPVFSALRYPNFRWFWLNGVTQSMAMGMQFLILGWLVLELTDSASQLGRVFFVYGIPNLLFAMFGGIVADRIDRLKLLIITQLAVSLLIFTLAVLTITDLVEIWHIYGVVAIIGTVQALNMPARMAVVADLVQRKDMMNAVALYSLVNQSGQIIGPGMAGFVIKLVGIGPTLFLNGGFYVSGIVFFLFIRGLTQQKPTGRASILGDLWAGLQCIWSSQVLLAVLVIAISFGFFGMAHRQVLPAFAKEVLEAGPDGTGLLLLSAGLGSLLGSIILASLGNFQRKSWFMVASALFFCLTMFLFSWTPWYWGSFGIIFFVGVASFGWFWSLATTLVQLNVPSDFRGRVLSVMQFAPALHYLGAWPVAKAAEAVNWPIAIAAGPAIFLVVCLWFGLWRPTLRRLKM